MTTPIPTERALIAEPAALNELLTKLFEPFYGEKRSVQIHPAAFTFEPQGNRLLVVNYPKPEKYGGLALPTDNQDNSGMGVVLSLGFRCFTGGSSSLAQTNRYDDLGDILYRTVVYGQYKGSGLRLNYTRDTTFWSDVLVLSDLDIWAIRYPELGQPYRVPKDYLDLEGML